MRGFSGLSRSENFDAFSVSPLEKRGARGEFPSQGLRNNITSAGEKQPPLCFFLLEEKSGTMPSFMNVGFSSPAEGGGKVNGAEGTPSSE